MPTLADTTIRLLGQEPLAGVMPTADQLRLAEILDQAGFAYLEVSGGGCFECQYCPIRLGMRRAIFSSAGSTARAAKWPAFRKAIRQKIAAGV